VKKKFRAPELVAHSRLEQFYNQGIPTLALVLMFAGLGTAACNQKKSSSKPAPSPSPQVSADPKPAPPESANGTGTSGQFVGTQDLQPFDDVTPQSGNALPQQMNEVAQLIYGYDLPFDSYNIEGFVPSQAEVAAEQCMNEYLAQIKFQQADQASSGTTNPNVTAVVPEKTVFNSCFDQRKGVSGSKINTDFKVNIYLNCVELNGQTGPNLANVLVTAPEWNRGFCEVGTKSEVRYNISLEVQQANTAATNPNQSPAQANPSQNAGQTLRYYKRTKALTSTTAGSCSWTWSQTERVKSFNDCVFLDRIDVGPSSTARFAYAEFDRVTGQQSLAGGFQFTGGQAKVRLNNIEGAIAFNTNSTPSWSMTKSGTQTPVTGQVTIPAGHGIAPTVFPGSNGTGYPATPGQGGAGQPYQPGQAGTYVPITGPGGAQELRCDSRVSVQNIQSFGNGYVTQHSIPVGNATYYAGYFHPNQTDTKISFLAKIENNQLAWCRTYVVKNNGSSEGLFVAAIGDQYYTAFVSNRDVYIPIGSAVFQNVRSPQDTPSIYIVKFDAGTGNPTNATWFNPFTTDNAKLSTVILDGQQLGQGSVRLRAFLTGAKPPGCDTPGTGDYGILLKSDLSGLVNERAEYCPSQR
jgi:hypothetical protein